MKSIKLLLPVALLAACTTANDETKTYKTTESEQNKITSEYAKVSRMQGLFVFVESMPAKAYKTLGEVNTESYVDQVEATNKNKKPLRAALDILTTTYKNLDYSEKLSMLIENAKAQYKDAAEGIIIRGNMKTCEAITFKTE